MFSENQDIDPHKYQHDPQGNRFLKKVETREPTGFHDETKMYLQI